MNTNDARYNCQDSPPTNHFYLGLIKNSSQPTLSQQGAPGPYGPSAWHQSRETWDARSSDGCANAHPRSSSNRDATPHSRGGHGGRGGHEGSLQELEGHRHATTAAEDEPPVAATEHGGAHAALWKDGGGRRGEVGGGGERHRRSEVTIHSRAEYHAEWPSWGL